MVLIVAKCIVNGKIVTNCDGYNSVLIVAKCIVNTIIVNTTTLVPIVLIVAKCIVNVLYKISKFSICLY